MDAAEGKGNFGGHEEASEAVERKGKVDEYDADDRDHKSLEVALGNAIAHTAAPELVNALSADPPMTNEEY